MILGYARVSTDDQSTDLQRKALKRAKCKRVFEDAGVSGVMVKQPQLAKALAALQPDDVFVVWKLDRLGRSLSDLIHILKAIESKGAQFRSLTENIDTTTASGQLVFHIMGAMAQFERSLIVERTRAGLEAAKARGERLGRRPKLTAQQVSHARKLVEGGERVKRVAKSLGVSDDTLYRAFHAEDTKQRVAGRRSA